MRWAARQRPTRTSRTPARSRRLPLEQVHLVDVDRLAVAVDQDDDRKTDPHLRGGDGDHEQRERLPGEVVQRLRERDQVDVDGVQHELDRHEHEDGVAPRQHAVDTRREQDGGEEQNERQADHERSSFRESTMAPIRAASRRNETASNGSTYWRNSDPPSAPVVTWIGWILGSLQWNAFWMRNTSPASTPSPTRSAMPRCWLSSASRPIGALVSIRPNRNRITIAPTEMRICTQATNSAARIR